jgi:plasmid stability protein
MAALTIRNLPNDVVKRLKSSAARNRRSMEQEVRELLRERYAQRADVLKQIRESWKELPETSVKNVNRWVRSSRKREALRGH